jgi:putative two-component system response regulator
VPEAFADARIFLLDDNETNLAFLSKLLRKVGYQNLILETDPAKAVSIVASQRPDLIITDLHMPGMSGYEVIERLRALPAKSYLPILVFTADSGGEARQRALRLGATDFLTKPGDATEITLRVRNFLEMRALHLELEQYSGELERKVEERTRKLEAAQIEIVHRLARTGEYRDDDTGQHCNRIADMAYRVAVECGLPEQEAALVRLAAPLHDIGKVGIPDKILHKPGRLTPEEYEQIRTHTEIGAKILANSESDVLRMAYAIALHHHDRWDGARSQLAGADIPIAGRIVAVADVFDALISERPYKAAWPQKDAVAEIERCSGTQFDPDVVAAFLRVIGRQSQPLLTVLPGDLQADCEEDSRPPESERRAA